MTKEKITLEYPLENSSVNILWEMISNPVNLSLWFADEVNVKDNVFTFLWKEYSQSALLKELKEGKYIRFQWDEDSGTDYYFQLEIETQDLSEQKGLLITDFAEKDDVDDTILLWNNEVETLKRKAGM
jgi:uncharacterized protein YndB with AHSA1/START domain